jgi:hypothetical protein
LKDEAYAAMVELLALTESPVDWAYDVWDALVADLESPDNHERAFAAQLLARLALSDPRQRIKKSFRALEKVMTDARFVTARHTIQSIWRVGLAGAPQERLVLNALEARFIECAGEKNASLIRSDLLVSLAALANSTQNARIDARVAALLEGEADEKLQKKLQAVWSKARKTAASSTSAGKRSPQRPRSAKATKTKAAPRGAAITAGAADVPAFLEKLEHARKDEVERLRAIILAADENLTERVKWNAPSFCYQGDDRITFRLQPGDRVELVFHRGAKVRSDAATFAFEDPSGLVQWASKDRGVVTFESMAEVKRYAPKLRKLIVAWLAATV